MVEQTESPSPGARRGPGLRRRDIAILAAVLVVAGVVTALVIPSSSAPRASATLTTKTSSTFAGLTVSPQKAEPPLALDNYLGTPVNIAADRGKVVLVTFLYTHCPDVCPLIASKLHTVWTQMSAAERGEVRIIAVSVDPRGDTRATVTQFLADHRVTGEMQYLIGSATALAHVWENWGIASRPSSDPALVDHSALIYGIDARGKISVIYAANFAPKAVIHDVPLLART